MMPFHVTPAMASTVARTDVDRIRPSDGDADVPALGDDADSSVAGEEDPGAALDLGKPGAKGPEPSPP
jgi:hypothetical protein